jgi:hypothetical protein
LIACEENEPEKIPPIPKVRSEIAASAAIMDSVSVAPNTVDTVAILDTLKTITLSILSCDTIKTAYEKAKDKEKKYIEGVVLEAFEGIAIEAAAIELFREGNWAQIHVDYYDGMPIGCKRFYTFKGELVAVEHIVLEEIINESGSKIEELLTQVNFYRKDSLLKVDFKDKATATEQSTWQEEQKKDWEVIQQYL